MPDSLEAKLDRLAETVEQVHDDVRAVREQAELTNGRVNGLQSKVSKIKDDLNGYQVGTRKVAGVIERVENMEPLTRKVAVAIKVGWILAVAMIGQLAMNMFELFG